MRASTTLPVITIALKSIRIAFEPGDTGLYRVLRAQVKKTVVEVEYSVKDYLQI
jgi:hypothetical protein